MGSDQIWKQTISLLDKHLGFVHISTGIPQHHEPSFYMKTD